MFGWLRRKKVPSRLHPENLWRVRLTDHAVQVRDPKGSVAILKIADLSAVTVDTNDTGPWGADVWWALRDTKARVGGAFRQGATGEQTVIDHLQSLPGFDFGQLGEAMRSTDVASFVVWQR